MFLSAGYSSLPSMTSISMEQVHILYTLVTGRPTSYLAKTRINMKRLKYSHIAMYLQGLTFDNALPMAAKLL